MPRHAAKKYLFFKRADMSKDDVKQFFISSGPKPEPCSRKWGAHASGVPSEPSLLRLQQLIFDHPLMNKNQWNELSGRTPNTARQRRALPFQMNRDTKAWTLSGE